MKKILLALILILILAAYLIVSWSTNAGPLQVATNVLIPRGSGSGAVALRLEEAGVINKPWLFKLVGRINGLDKKLRAGEYQFEPGVTMIDVMQKMAKGEIFYRKITLPEGLYTSQILDIINDEPFLSGEISVDVKEGELLPETYSFVYGDTKDSIILHAKKAMNDALNRAWEFRDAGLPINDTNELLILASIIEKETGVEEERGLVASVFVNRLKKRMLLQTDPTVIYAITDGKNDLGRTLTRVDLKIDNPYNTYKYAGLPPGPICNPGMASITAAATPEVSDYIYFVADGKGGHNFSRSLNEHNRHVQNYRAQRIK